MYNFNQEFFGKEVDILMNLEDYKVETKNVFNKV
jgi:hypothetical protein